MDSIRQQLRINPHDWPSWLVFADWAIEQADVRGALVTLEYEVASGLRPGALAERRALIDAHRDAWSPLLGEDDNDLLDWQNDVETAMKWAAERQDDLGPLAPFPSGWLLAMLADPQDSPSLLRRRGDQMIATALQRIERAFDGVPPPDPQHRTLFQAEAADNWARCDQSQDHLGRWQDVPDAHFLINQHALSHLDYQGMHYYLPAVMSFELRGYLDVYLGHKRGPHWILESLEYTLQPEARRSDLRGYSWERFQTLTREQRRAIWMFTVLTRNDRAADAWGRVVMAESEQPRPDWFELFVPNPTASRR